MLAIKHLLIAMLNLFCVLFIGIYLAKCGFSWICNVYCLARSPLASILPFISLLSKYGVEIHGRFICAGNASRLLLMLQTDKLIDRIFDSSEYEIGCNCPNCVDVYGYNT